MKDYGTAQLDFVSLLTGVYAIADKVEESNFDITDLHDFIIAQTANNECQLVATIVGRPKTSLLYDANGPFVLMSSVDGASHQYVLIALRPHVLRLYHLLTIDRTPRRVTTVRPMRRDFSGHTLQTTYMLLYTTACHAQENIIQREDNANYACSDQLGHESLSPSTSTGPWQRRKPEIDSSSQSQIGSRSSVKPPRQQNRQ